MAITLTENAAKQIQRQLEKRGKGIALRIGVKKVGCSGLAHTFEIADEIRRITPVWCSMPTAWRSSTVRVSISSPKGSSRCSNLIIPTSKASAAAARAST
jgi:Fe-S cluster assembly iron-binding protein IscA